MTEQEWLEGIGGFSLFDFVSNSGQASDRKLRLFICSSYLSFPEIIGDSRGKRAIEVAELYADGLVDLAALERAIREAGRLPYKLSYLHPEGFAHHDVPPADRVGYTAAALIRGISRALDYNPARQLEVAAYRNTILRDLFGPLLFRKIRIDPAWLAWNGGTVVKLAQAAYEDRHPTSGLLDNARLAVLADALEEAGCQDTDILNHCRQPGEHVRGCWVVDLLLGKS
jgi:hypothetical protein